jgi:peptidoglycan/xylan/chitin deacetylase (PgdA/CDA1 family)
MASHSQRPSRGRRRPALVAVAVVLVAVAVAAVVVVVLRGGADWLAPGGGTAGPPSGTTAAPTTSAVPTTTSTPQPPPGLPDALRGQDLEVLPTSDRVVALTFDAGGDAAGLESILGTLAAAEVPGTFFLTGRWAEANPDGVAAIAAAGHRLGNHSATHPAFTTLTAAAIRDEVLGAEAAIRAAGGDPRPLFRFPLGDRDERTIAAVNDLGYVAVRWTVDTLGWQGTSGGRSAQEVVDRVLGALRPGEIVLMHVGSHPDDGSTLDADALPDLIAQLRAAGYTFTTLDALLQP